MKTFEKMIDEFNKEFETKLQEGPSLADTVKLVTVHFSCFHEKFRRQISRDLSDPPN